MPAECDQDRDRNQGAGDHDGNGNTHVELWNIDGRNKNALTLSSPIFSSPVERYLPPGDAWSTDTPSTALHRGQHALIPWKNGPITRSPITI
jgi:hypothetical protein